MNSENVSHRDVYFDKQGRVRYRTKASRDAVDSIGEPHEQDLERWQEIEEAYLQPIVEDEN